MNNDHIIIPIIDEDANEWIKPQQKASKTMKIIKGAIISFIVVFALFASSQFINVNQARKVLDGDGESTPATQRRLPGIRAKEKADERRKRLGYLVSAPHAQVDKLKPEHEEAGEDVESTTPCTATALEPQQIKQMGVKYETEDKTWNFGWIYEQFLKKLNLTVSEIEQIRFVDLIKGKPGQRMIEITLDDGQKKRTDEFPKDQSTQLVMKFCAQCLQSTTKIITQFEGHPHGRELVIQLSALWFNGRIPWDPLAVKVDTINYIVVMWPLSYFDGEKDKQSVIVLTEKDWKKVTKQPHQGGYPQLCTCID